jgi:hypothetical protein
VAQPRRPTAARCVGSIIALQGGACGLGAAVVGAPLRAFSLLCDGA